MSRYEDMKGIVNGIIAIKALRELKHMMDGYETRDTIIETLERYIALIDFEQEDKEDSDVREN